MSKAEGFRQYAEEAVRWARKSKTEQPCVGPANPRPNEKNKP